MRFKSKAMFWRNTPMLWRILRYANIPSSGLRLQAMFPLGCDFARLRSRAAVSNLRAAVSNCRTVNFNVTKWCTFDENQAAELRTLVWRVEIGWIRTASRRCDHNLTRIDCEAQSKLRDSLCDILIQIAWHLIEGTLHTRAQNVHSLTNASHSGHHFFETHCPIDGCRIIAIFDVSTSILQSVVSFK